MKDLLCHLKHLSLKKVVLFSILHFCFCLPAFSAIKVSIASGNWTNGAIWFPSGAPVAGDFVTIQAAHSVTCNANPTNCFSLTVNGTATMGNVSANITGSLLLNGTITFTSTAGVKTFQSVTMGNGSVWTNGQGETFNISTDFTMQGGTINGNSTGRYNIGGNWNVSSGINNIGRGRFNVTGTSTIAGTLNITSTAGAKNLNNFIVTSTGSFNCAVAESWRFNGNVQINGVFNANLAVYRFYGINKTVSGTTAAVFDDIRCNGSYTNNGNITTTTRLFGTGTWTQGTGILNLPVTNANFSVNTFNASATGNTVNYSRGGNQNIRLPNDGAYYNLTCSGTGIKSLLAATNINGNLNISSTLDVTATNYALNVGGNWTNTGTFTPRNGTVTLNGTAQIVTKASGEVFYNLICAGSGTKTLGGAITTNNNLTINVGSGLDVNASNFLITVRQNWINNGTFFPRNGTVTFNGTTAQTIGGSPATTFYNINSASPVGVSITSAHNLQGTLAISATTFTTSGQIFTILSNTSGTGRIAAIPLGMNFIGNITMQRFITGATSWRTICSPVTGQTLASWYDDFAMQGFTGVIGPNSPFCSVYTYDETKPFIKDTGWVKATNVTNSIPVTKGFLCYIGPNPITVDVTGTPNKFAIALPLTYTANNTAPNIGWNLISNPYPSSVDWDGVGWTKINLNDAVYVWNPALQQYASYVSGVGTNGGSNIIPSSQAFFVQANATAPSLTITENSKSGTDQPYMHLMQSQLSYYNLTLDIFGNNNQDQTIIRFDQNATNNFDANFDAYKLTGGPGTPFLSSVMDTFDYSINSVPLPTLNISIPVRVKVSVTGTYTITKNNLSSIPNSSCVILEDLLTGTTTDLQNLSSYTFTIADTTSVPRFLIHISPPIQKQSFGEYCFGDSIGYAVATGNGTGPFTYVWKDSLGNILQTTNSITTSDTLFNLPAGIYTVEISDPNSICGTLSDTIIINQPAQIIGNIIATDVSCNSANDGSALLQISGGTVPYTYSWSNGSTLQNPSGLNAGTYSVLITDINGCTGSANAIINQTSQVVSAFTASNDTTDLMFLLGYISITNSSSGSNSYQWDFGDGSPFDTTANPIHYYQTIGTFTVTLIASNGICSDTSTFLITVLAAPFGTGINENLISNPVNVVYENNSITLDFNFESQTKFNLSVTSVLGQNITPSQELKISNGQIKIPFMVAKGIYFVIIKTENEIYVKKIEN